jgi:Thioredoxin
MVCRCGHCKAFKATYHDVGRTLSPEGYGVAMVNGEDERALAMRFGVQGYPTILHIKGTEVREYEGRRSKEQVLAFARGGYASVQPRPWLTSGMSPINIAIARGIRAIVAVGDTANPVAEFLGVPVVGVQFFYVLLAILATTGSFVFCALYLGDHCSRIQPEHEHRD